MPGVRRRDLTANCHSNSLFRISELIRHGRLRRDGLRRAGVEDAAPHAFLNATLFQTAPGCIITRLPK
jgi:hypothetical protein